MQQLVQFGIRRLDGSVSPAPTTLPSAWEEAAQIAGARVVCRIVMVGVWGQPGGRCPVHFLTHCVKCGWVA